MFKSQLEPSAENFVETQIFVENIFDTVKKAREAKAARSLAESKLAHYDYSFDFSPSKRKKTRKNAKAKTPKNGKTKPTTPKKKPRKPRTPKDSAEKKKKTPTTPKTPRKYTKRAKVKPQNDIDDEEAAFILSSISQRSFDSFYNRLNGSTTTHVANKIQIPLETSTVVQPPVQPQQPTTPQKSEPNHLTAYHHVLLDHNYWIVEPPAPAPPTPTSTVVVTDEPQEKSNNESQTSMNLLLTVASHELSTQCTQNSTNSIKVEVNNNKLPLLDVNCDTPKLSTLSGDNAVKKRWLRQATTECSTPSPTVTPPETSPNDMKAPLKKRRVVREMDDNNEIKIGACSETESSKIDQSVCFESNNFKNNVEAIKFNNNFVNNSALLKCDPAESVNINLREIHEKMEMEFGRQLKNEQNVVVVKEEPRSVIQSPIGHQIHGVKNNLTYGIQMSSPVDVNAIYGRSQAENLIKIDQQRSLLCNEGKLPHTQLYDEKLIKIEPHERPHDFRPNNVNIVEVKFNDKIPQVYGLKSEVYDNIQHAVKPEIFDHKQIKAESSVPEKVITVDGKLQQILDGKIQKIYRDNSQYFVDQHVDQKVQNYGQFYNKVAEPLHQMSVIQGLDTNVENSYRHQMENLQKQNHIIIHTGSLNDKKMPENFHDQKVYSIYGENNLEGFPKIHQLSPSKGQLSPTKLSQLKGLSSPTKIQISPTRTYEIYTKNPHENIAESLLKLQQESPVKLLQMSPTKVIHSPTNFQVAKALNFESPTDHGYQKKSEIQAENSPKKLKKTQKAVKNSLKVKTKTAKVKKTPTKAKKVQKPKKVKTPKSPSKVGKNKKNSVKIDKNLIKNFGNLEDVPLKIRQNLAFEEKILMKMKECDGKVKENHGRVSESDGRMSEAELKMLGKIEGIIPPMDSKFLQIGGKIMQIDGKFNQNEVNFPQNELKVHQNDTKFNQIDTKFHQNDTKVPQFDAKFHQNDTKVPQFEGKFKPSEENFHQIDGKSKQFENNFNQNDAILVQNPAIIHKNDEKSPQNSSTQLENDTKLFEALSKIHGTDVNESDSKCTQNEDKNHKNDRKVPQMLSNFIQNEENLHQNDGNFKHLDNKLDKIEESLKQIDENFKKIDAKHFEVQEISTLESPISHNEPEKSQNFHHNEKHTRFFNDIEHHKFTTNSKRTISESSSGSSRTSSCSSKTSINADFCNNLVDYNKNSTEITKNYSEPQKSPTKSDKKALKKLKFDDFKCESRKSSISDECEVKLRNLMEDSKDILSGDQHLVNRVRDAIKSPESGRKMIISEDWKVNLTNFQMNAENSSKRTISECSSGSSRTLSCKSPENTPNSSIFHSEGSASVNIVPTSTTLSCPSQILSPAEEIKQESPENLSKAQISVDIKCVDTKVHTNDAKIHQKDNKVHKKSGKISKKSTKNLVNETKIHQVEEKVHQNEEKIPQNEAVSSFLASSTSSSSKNAQNSHLHYLSSAKSSEVGTSNDSHCKNRKLSLKMSLEPLTPQNSTIQEKSMEYDTVDGFPSKKIKKFSRFEEISSLGAKSSDNEVTGVETEHAASFNVEIKAKSSNLTESASKLTSGSTKEALSPTSSTTEPPLPSKVCNDASTSCILLSKSSSEEMKSPKTLDDVNTLISTKSEELLPKHDSSSSTTIKNTPQASPSEIINENNTQKSHSEPSKTDDDIIKSIIEPPSILKSLSDGIAPIMPIIDSIIPFKSTIESLESIIDTTRSISESSSDLKPEKVVEQQVASILEKVIPKTLKGDFVKEIEDEVVKNEPETEPIESDNDMDDEDDTPYRESVEEFHKDTLEKLIQANKRFCRESIVHNPFKHSVSYDGRDIGRYSKADDYHSRGSRGYDYDDHRKPLKMSLSFDSHQQYPHHNYPPHYQRSISEVFNDPRKERWCGNGMYENRNYGSFHYDKIHHREPITTTYSMYRAQKASQMESRWSNRQTYEYPQEPQHKVNSYVPEKPLMTPQQQPITPTVINSYKPPPPEPIRIEPPVLAVSPQAEALKNATSDPFAGFLKDTKLIASVAASLATPMPKTKTASHDPRLNPSLVQDVKKDEPATPKKKLSLDQYRKRKSLTSVTQISPTDETLPSISVSIAESPSPTLTPAFDPTIAAAAATG